MLSRRFGVAAVLAALALLLPSTGAAVPLDQILAAGSFSSGNGLLTFEFGEDAFTVSGNLPPDAEDYEVVILEEGFQLEGSITVADGEQGSLSLDYAVLAAGSIESTRLETLALVAGPSDTATVWQAALRETQTSQEALFLQVGPDFLVDDASFDPPAGALDFQTRIDVAAESAASISYVRHTLTVPEPAGGALGIAALGALAALGRAPGTHRGKRRPDPTG